MRRLFKAELRELITLPRFPVQNCGRTTPNQPAEEDRHSRYHQCVFLIDLRQSILAQLVLEGS